MRILVVEDEPKIAQAIKRGLEQERYTVDVACDGREGYDLALTPPSYGIIILDLMIPYLDGITLAKKLREENIHTPILMLTAKSQIEDKVSGLDSGADDYLSKPFAFTELLARVRALTRRPITYSNNTVLSYNDLSLDKKTFQVIRANTPIQLSKKEFSLLEYLLLNQEIIVTKDKIIENVWNYDADILPNTIEVYIGYLRQKIDKAFPESFPLIHTVRGFGYRLGEK